jgi:hypothetical protein
MDEKLTILKKLVKKKEIDLFIKQTINDISVLNDRVLNDPNVFQNEKQLNLNNPDASCSLHLLNMSEIAYFMKRDMRVYDQSTNRISYKSNEPTCPNDGIS